METKGQYCTGCTHYRLFSRSNKSEGYACHYSLDTDKLRGYTAEECGKNKIRFEPKIGKKVKVTNYAGWPSYANR